MLSIWWHKSTQVSIFVTPLNAKKDRMTFVSITKRKALFVDRTYKRSATFEIIWGRVGFKLRKNASTANGVQFSKCSTTSVAKERQESLHRSFTRPRFKRLSSRYHANEWFQNGCCAEIRSRVETLKHLLDRCRVPASQAAVPIPTARLLLLPKFVLSCRVYRSGRCDELIKLRDNENAGASTTQARLLFESAAALSRARFIRTRRWHTLAYVRIAQSSSRTLGSLRRHVNMIARANECQWDAIPGIGDVLNDAWMNEIEARRFKKNVVRPLSSRLRSRRLGRATTSCFSSRVSRKIVAISTRPLARTRARTHVHTHAHASSLEFSLAFSPRIPERRRRLSERTTRRQLQRVAPPRRYVARRPHVTTPKLEHSRAHVSSPPLSLSLFLPLARICLFRSPRNGATRADARWNALPPASREGTATTPLRTAKLMTASRSEKARHLHAHESAR